MTGGHGDFRQMTESRHNHGYCSCGDFNSVCVVADGVDECLKAVREELRRGAHCIKIMGSGGVASPTDPIWMNQYREDEIRAIVNETTERRTYTSAHCHPGERDPPLRRVRRALHRARHADRRRDRPLRRRARRLHRADDGRSSSRWSSSASSSASRRRARRRPRIASTPGADRARVDAQGRRQARLRHRPARRRRTCSSAASSRSAAKCSRRVEILRQATSINAEIMMRRASSAA